MGPESSTNFFRAAMTAGRVKSSQKRSISRRSSSCCAGRAIARWIRECSLLSYSHWRISNPTNSDLIQFFQILRDSADQIVFVHCEFGRDRTGVMIAAYRIAFQKWSSDHALTEMDSFGFNRLWHPSMISYVRNLPTRLQSEPDLKKALEPTPE